MGNIASSVFGLYEWDLVISSLFQFDDDHCSVSSNTKFNWPKEFKWPEGFINKIKQEPYVVVNTPYLLDEMYTFREPNIVKEYLVSNTFLRPILEEAAEKIRNYFPSSPLVLEVISNPEEEDDTYLVLFIKTNLAPFNAVEQLNRLDEEWFLSLPAKLKQSLSINLEFFNGL